MEEESEWESTEGQEVCADVGLEVGGEGDAVRGVEDGEGAGERRGRR